MSVIVLTKCEHPSGRHTLKQSVDGKLAFDLRGELFGNLDKVAFDKAVDAHVIELKEQGHTVSVKG